MNGKREARTFWRAAAACALLIAGVSWWQGRASPASAASSGGANGDGFICAVGGEAGNCEHLYVFDTVEPRLAVYESRDAAPNQTKQVLLLTYARRLRNDIALVKSRRDLEYKPAGYAPEDIEDALKQDAKKK